MKDELLYNQIYDRTKEFGRSQFVRELQRLERVNKYLESSHKELIKWINNEIEETDRKINTGYKFLGDSKGNYHLRMNLTYYKNALVNVLKKIDKLERIK